MSGTEGAPSAAPQPDPAAANQADLSQTPEQLAANAEQRMEDVYDTVLDGKIGVRDALFDRVEPGRPEDTGGTPALYADGIGFTRPSSVSSEVSGVLANRETTIPGPYATERSGLDAADADLGFNSGSASPSAGPEGRARLSRRVALVTRNEAGEPLYEDVAMLRSVGMRSPDTSLEGEFLVRRNNMRGSAPRTNYSQDIHPDPVEFTRIVTEATDIVLAAAQRRAEQAQAEAAGASKPEEATAIAEASRVLAAL